MPDYRWYHLSKGKGNKHQALKCHRFDIKCVSKEIRKVALKLNPLPHKLHIKCFPWSMNLMNGFMYALQREHLMGPISPKSTSCNKKEVSIPKLFSLGKKAFLPLLQSSIVILPLLFKLCDFSIIIL